VDTFEQLIDAVFDRLTDEAERHDGTLVSADLRRVKQNILTEPEFRAAAQISQSSVARSHLENRTHVFQRIMVGQFEKLLRSQEEIDTRLEGLPRQFLPGFFVALEKMLGQESIAEYDKRCERIAARLAQEKGDAFTWQDVYADSEANDVILDPLTMIASYFENIDRRTQWFVELVNSHLPTIENKEAEGATAAQQWHLSTRAFYIFLDAIFSQIRKNLAQAHSRQEFERRYSKRTLETVTRVLAEIEQRLTGMRQQPA
jgi:hypothetical protein